MNFETLFGLIIRAPWSFRPPEGLYQVSGVVTVPWPPQLVLQFDFAYPDGVAAFLNWVTTTVTPVCCRRAGSPAVAVAINRDTLPPWGMRMWHAVQREPRWSLLE